MDCSNIPITDLIPQRPPFVMVDRLTACDASDARTEFVVRPDNFFLKGDLLSSEGLMENMAQSCAARIGYLNTMKNEGVKVGFIGDIRKCAFLRQPRIGEKMTTFVHIVEDVLNLTLAETEVKIDDETIAYATMKIATVEKSDGKQD